MYCVLPSNTGSTDHQLVSCHPVTYTDQITIVPPLPSGDDEAAAPPTTLLAAGEDTTLDVEIKPRYTAVHCRVNNF